MDNNRKRCSSRGCPKQVILSHAQPFEQHKGNNYYFQDQTLIVKIPNSGFTVILSKYFYTANLKTLLFYNTWDEFLVFIKAA